MADYNLGSAHGEIVIKYDGKEMDKAKADVEDIDKSSKKVEESAKRSSKANQDLGTGMVLVGGAAVAGLALAVRSATNFEDALAGVRAAGNASAADLDKLRNKALQLGADTKFSATEAAQAMEALIKAGLTTNDVLNGAADAAVNLAAAERIDLTEASEIAATAMTAFNLKASDLPKIADTISRSASATKQTVSDFAQAMNQAGAVSKLVGLSFDDMALAITAMGKAGIVGSDAGTSLKTMLMNLNPQTKEQKKLMRELGIVTKDGANQFFDATGKVKSMTQIAGVLQGALKGMTEQQKLSTLETLFGSDAIRAAAIIADQGAAGMVNLSKEMGSQLSVAEKAKIQMDSFAGTLENFKGTMETAAIGIGKVLLPILDKIVKVIGALVGWFDKLPGPVKSVVTWGLALGGMLLLLTGGIIKIVGTIAKYVEILKLVKLGQIAALLTNPWFLIAVAVAIAVLLIIKYWDEILAFLTMIWNWIVNLAKTVWQGFLDWWNGFWSGVAEAWNELWRKVTDYATALWEQFIGFWKGLWDDVWGFITGLLGRIAQFFRDVWNSIVDAVSGAARAVIQFIRELPGKILDIFSGAGRWLFDIGRDIIMGLWEGIQSVFGWVMDRIHDVGQGISNAFSAVLSIFSPSKVFRDFGVYTLEGYVLGLEDMEGTVINKVSDVAANVAIVGDPSSTMPAVPLGGSTRGGDGANAPTSAGITIQNLNLSVAGNLDPSNPTEFRRTIKQIKVALEAVEKEMR